MTSPAKETLSRWLPSIVAICALLVHVVTIARWSATVDARMGNLEHRSVPVERMYELFPSRVEWAAQNAARNVEIAELKSLVRETNGKIDQLYQLQIRRDAAAGR